jgi:uncharacterized membrane protein
MVRALPVRPEPLWRVDYRQRIAVSLWFIPSLFALLAVGAAFVAIWLDDTIAAPVRVRFGGVGDPATAASVAGAIAAATLAFVAVVFGTTLVAIQLAASQYSPRTVRVFIRSRVTRLTLGLFLATFVFSLVILISNRASVSSAKQYAPVISVTLLVVLTLATVFGFVAYLHGVVRLMRVQYLMETIANETRLSVLESFPPAAAYIEAEPPVEDPSPQLLLYAGRPGVVTAFDLDGLVELCRQQGGWLQLIVRVGEYLDHGTPFAIVHGCRLEGGNVQRLLLVRNERTFFQDPAFGFRQLVDVASRALSPAVNDPTTAVQSIDRITDALVLTGRNPDPTGFLVDSEGKVRLQWLIRNFDELLILSMTEPIRYGADAPQVVRRLRALLAELECTLPVERHAALIRQRELLDAAVESALPHAFAAVASVPDRTGFG